MRVHSTLLLVSDLSFSEILETQCTFLYELKNSKNLLDCQFFIEILAADILSPVFLWNWLLQVLVVADTFAKPDPPSEHMLMAALANWVAVSSSRIDFMK